MATTKPKVEPDPRIPTAVSSWDQRAFGYLNAEYETNVCIDFTFGGSMMSSELKNGAFPNFFRG